VKVRKRENGNAGMPESGRWPAQALRQKPSQKIQAESSVSAKQILNSRFYQYEAIGKGAHARIAASDAKLRCEGSRWSAPLPPQIPHSQSLHFSASLLHVTNAP